MGHNEPRQLVTVVACVLARADGSVLLARRPKGRFLAGLWEFPGGKIEAGEEPEQALIRELAEELDIRIAKASLKPLTFVSHAYPGFHLLMPLYLCRAWEGNMVAKEGQELAWVRPDRLGQYDMPPADEPLKASLDDLMRCVI